MEDVLTEEFKPLVQESVRWNYAGHEDLTCLVQTRLEQFLKLLLDDLQPGDSNM